MKKQYLAAVFCCLLTAGAAEMVSIPGGSFTMGDPNGKPDEKPRTVTVSPFLIDKYEVTQAVLFVEVYITVVIGQI